VELAKKLQIRAGNSVLILGAPDGYVDELQPLPAGVELAHRAKGHYDVVQLFVEKRADFDKRAPVAAKAVKPGGVLWIAWPKGGSGRATDFNRDTLNAAASKLGLRAVSNVSIDETWSALRFKPAG